MSVRGLLRSNDAGTAWCILSHSFVRNTVFSAIMQTLHVEKNIAPPDAVARVPIAANDVFAAVKYAEVNKRRRLCYDLESD